jgi:hypothetical protein
MNSLPKVLNFLSIIIFIVFVARSGFAAVYLVTPDGSGDAATIQDAIIAAAPNDTIYLDNGTFTGTGNKDLDPGGKNLLIMAAPGAAPIIDCESSGRAFYIHSGEDASMIIRGLELANGYAPGDMEAKGGAILIENASPTVIDNEIIGNQASYGAAVHMYNSSSHIVRNSFIDNEIPGGSYSYGSYIDIRNSSACLYDNQIVKEAWDALAAVYMHKSTVSIECNKLIGNGWVDGETFIHGDSSDVTVAGNHFMQTGGGVQLNDCTGTIRANHFFECVRWLNGGGVYSINSEADVEFNYFERVTDGAIDWANGSTGTIQRNVITGSRIRPLDSGARAVSMDEAGATICGNTFYENEVEEPPYNSSAADVQGAGSIYGCMFVNSTAVDYSVVCEPPPWRSANAASRINRASWDIYGVNWHWGYPSIGIIEFCYGYPIWSIEVSPVLVDPDNDNFFITGGLPDDTTLVGALPPANTTSDVLLTTVPSDIHLNRFSAPLHLILSGFSVLNLSNFPAPVNYRLLIAGPAFLEDNGDPSSLAGSTPVLEPGQTWTPPAAKLILDTPVLQDVVTVRYITAYAPALAIPDTTTMTVLIDDATTVTPAGNSQGFALEQNFPNPANPVTTIGFSLDESAHVLLTLYDVRGRLVQTLASGPYDAGRYMLEWDGRNRLGQLVPSGIYFYRLETGSFADTKKLVLLR